MCPIKWSGDEHNDFYTQVMKDISIKRRAVKAKNCTGIYSAYCYQQWQCSQVGWYSHESKGPNLAKQTVRTCGKGGWRRDMGGIESKIPTGWSKWGGWRTAIIRLVCIRKESWGKALPFPSEHVWAPFFNTFHFSGHFLHIIGSRQFSSVSQTWWKHAWPRHSIAVTIPSILLALLSGEEKLFCFRKIEETRMLCPSRKAVPLAFQIFSAIRCYLHCTSHR